MGNPKLKWTAEEEEALLAGVAKHGTGKWKIILVDPEFADMLANRSNVDLKDKWRNLGANHGLGGEANVITPRKGKATASAAVTPKTVDKGQNMGADHEGCEADAMTPKKGKATATSAVTPKTKVFSSVAVSKGNSINKPSQNPQDVKNAPDYNALIFEAISSIKDGNGSEFGAILGFIEKKCDVPQGFRRLLSSRLRRFVLQGTLEKVQKRYKIKSPASVTNTATPKQKDVRSMALPNCRSTTSAETLENAAKIAAHKIAEAENKSFVAAEAVKESERVSQMAEEADAVLMRLKEIFQQWEEEDNTGSKSSREVILMM